MNFANNLKRVRKENNMSQEELAEKLGVSRQSVSKWESSSAYPEMDKMVQICKMFNLNMDDLLNQDIGEINNTKETKNKFNRFIDEVINYITKTINMFCDMSFKTKIKCLIEQVIIIFILVLVIKAIGTVCDDIFLNVFSFLPNKYVTILENFVDAVYLGIAFIFMVVLVFLIFKTRYLDYYDAKEIKEKNTDSEEKNNSDIQKEHQNRRIIIRDSKDTNYHFFKVVFKFILIFLKVIFSVIGIAFCGSFVGFSVLLIINFIFLGTGLFGFGNLILLLGAILLNYIILKMIYGFIFNCQIKFVKSFILGISSLFLIGLGIGLMAIGITSFSSIKFEDENYYVIDEYNYSMNDELFFESWESGINYVDNRKDDISIKVTHFKDSTVMFDTLDETDNGLLIHYNYDSMALVNDIIDIFKDKKFISNTESKITIYTNSSNIEKLNQNISDYYNQQKQNYCEEYIFEYNQELQ